MTDRCHSCGKTVTESETHARLEVGGETYLFCCPMCQSAFAAGNVQRRMVLQAFSDERASVFIEYVPALQVGGDYTCIRAVGDDKLYVIVADVSGHGIASSLVMSRVGAETERLVQSGKDLAAIAEALNRLMTSNAGGDLYLTLFGAEIDFSAQTITYINCGHPAQLLWSQKLQQSTLLQSEHIPVGMFDAETFGTPPKVTLDVHAGDKLMLFTDGMLELRLEDGREFGQDGLTRVFRELIKASSEEAKRLIMEQLKASQAERLEDDMLLVFVDIKGGASGRHRREGAV